MDLIIIYNNHVHYLRTLFFGPVGNSRIVFLMLHILYFFYQYPLYFYRCLPELWPEYKWTNLFYLVNNIVFWWSLYVVHLKDPGYLKRNTDEYQRMLKTVITKIFSIQYISIAYI